MKIVKVILFMILALLSLISCNTPTNPPTASLTGTVMLVNNTDSPGNTPVDYSGVTILLYNEPSDQGELSNVYNDYPGIGVLGRNGITFDHRTALPKHQTVTDLEGDFLFDNVTPGNFILVAYKEGWGFKYTRVTLESITGSSSTRSTNRPVQLNLYPDLRVGSVVEAPFILFNELNHYVIESNTFFSQSTNVEFAPGATIRVAPNVTLSFYGELKIQGLQDLPVTFMSDDQVYGNDSSSILPYERIEIKPSASITGQSISYTAFRDSRIGLQLENSTSIVNCQFANSEYGIYGTGISSQSGFLNVTNCEIVSSSSQVSFSISASNYASLAVNKTICYQSATGTYLQRVTTATISDNYYKSGSLCIGLYQDVEANISYNKLISGGMITDSFTRAYYVLYRNDLKSTDMGIVLQYYMTSVTANENNIDVANVAIDATTFYAPLINAENNYWYTTHEDEIMAKIIDRNDYQPSHPQYNLISIVDYTPFKTSPVVSAGIRP